MRNLLLFTAILLSSIQFSVAQDIELKKGKVKLDGKVILTYEKIDALQYSFYSLEDENEIIFYQYKNNNTPEYGEDDHFVINFLENGLKVESTNFRRVIKGLGMNSRKNMQKLIEWLIKEKVLSINGVVNEEKLARFMEKYNEDIQNRTIRH